MKNFASNKDILKKVLNHIGKYKIFLFFSVALAAISVILTLYIPILTGEARSEEHTSELQSLL